MRFWSNTANAGAKWLEGSWVVFTTQLQVKGQGEPDLEAP